jgi:hypothetical protein
MKIAVHIVSYSKHAQAVWITVTCFWGTDIQYLGMSETFAAIGNLHVTLKCELTCILKTKT